MAATQQDVDAMKTVLDTEISAIKQEIATLRRDLSGYTSNSDFQKLQQSMLNDMTKISKMFDDFGDQFAKHVTGPHAEINDRLAALEKEATNANAQRQELQQRLLKAEATVHSGTSSNLLAERNIQGAKVTAVYDQESGNISFADWAHKLKIYVNSLFSGAFRILVWSASQSDVIDPKNIPVHLTSTCDGGRLSETLYSILSSQTEGEALKVVRAEESTFNGLEAWRRLNSRFSPKSLVRGFQMKAKLSIPPACPSVDKVRECILSWESEVRRYVDMSGKSFDDDDKIGALIQIVPPQVQNHIRLNPEKADTYDNLRKLVFAYAAAIEEAKPVDMDLGSFQKQSQKTSTPSQGNW